MYSSHFVTIDHRYCELCECRFLPDSLFEPGKILLSSFSIENEGRPLCHVERGLPLYSTYELGIDRQIFVMQKLFDAPQGSTDSLTSNSNNKPTLNNQPTVNCFQSFIVDVEDNGFFKHVLWVCSLVHPTLPFLFVVIKKEEVVEKKLT